MILRASTQPGFEVITDDHGRGPHRGAGEPGKPQIIRQIEQIPEAPDGEGAKPHPCRESISRYVPPGGRPLYLLNGTDKPDRRRQRPHSQLRRHRPHADGGYPADVPIVIAAIDPCFSVRPDGETNASSEQERMMDWEFCAVIRPVVQGTGRGF